MFKAGFIGTNNIDIIFYLERLCVNLNLKTALIDASNEQLLKYSVPNEEDEEIIYRGVDIYFNRNTLNKLVTFDTSKYDMIIVNYGLNHEVSSDMQLCNVLILTTDFDRVNVLRLQETLMKLEDITIVKIYLDVMKTKISPKYIDTLLNIKKFKITKEYTIPFAEDNLKSRLISQYDDMFNFMGISDKFRNMLIDLAELYMNIDSKAVAKAIKKAEKGA